MASIALNFFLILSVLLFSHSWAQPTAPAPVSDSCNGVFLSYTVTKNQKIAPDLKADPTRQPYRFESTLSVLNNGLEELKAWRVAVGFRRRELLVSASGAVLADGATFPADVSNGTVFAGFPNSDLKTAVETAGDLTQMGVEVLLVGTQFGAAPPDVPMPANITLVDDGWICPKATMQGKSVMQVCCHQDPKFVANTTEDTEFLPRQNGDLTIMYDITRTYDSSYWADVTIANHNPLGRLDNWKLSWDWMRDEFIFAMKGAYPSVVDTSDCVFGKQGQYYKDLDFSNALSCEKRPILVDLPLEKTNDTTLGMVPNCCRNGTILPPSMDPSKSVSAFQINVYKMPPDVNRSELNPPANFQINGTLNPDYKCGPAIRVSPSQFPDPSGLSSKAAVASWQVVCNITQAKGASPRCCVSFSAYYNDSVVPCPTCACGCPTQPASGTCSATQPAMLLPPDASLKPFDNRTALTRAWASIHRLPVPNPMPCPDNCGVSLNWHLASDFRGGWSARITVFNWDDFAFPDWFAAVELPKTGAGFEKVYSFNGSTLEGVNNTFIMQGLKDMNYLVAMSEAPNPERDPPIPGKQQSVLSFTKKNLPVGERSINIAAGDGFPSKVFFNGEECALPRFLPTSGAHRSRIGIVSIVVAFVVLVLLQQ